MNRCQILRHFSMFFQNHLRTQLHEQTTAHKEQLALIEREKEELKTYKEQEVASFKVGDCIGIGLVD